MKTLLISLSAGAMLVTAIASPAVAGMNGGIESEYTLDGGAAQSLGGYVSVTKSFGPLTVGPQVSAGVIDPGTFMSGDKAIYGDVALTASLGTKLKLNGEVGYEYLHFDGESYDDMYVEAGLSFPLGTTVEVFSSVKWRGTSFSYRTIGAGVKLAF